MGCFWLTMSSPTASNVSSSAGARADALAASCMDLADLKRFRYDATSSTLFASSVFGTMQRFLLQQYIIRLFRARFRTARTAKEQANAHSPGKGEYTVLLCRKCPVRERRLCTKKHDHVSADLRTANLLLRFLSRRSTVLHRLRSTHSIWWGRWQPTQNLETATFLSTRHK